MKILLFIDSLGSGGAQRQLVNLAISFCSIGHEIEILTYCADNFYEKEIALTKIKHVSIPKCGYLKRVLKCRKYIRKGKFDAVISFLETPSLIAELATIPYHRWVNISGERSSAPCITKTIKGRLLRFAHLFSDYVVANSSYNLFLVKKACPFLSKNRLLTIYNSYDIYGKLSPDNYTKENRTDKKFHLLVAASHQKLKNLKNLAIAIKLLPEDKRVRIIVDWYGKKEEKCYNDSLKIIQELGIEQNFAFYDPTLEIYNKMINADAVGLFSLYEGLPNAICEAMCLAKPVIATNVSDNKLLIDNQQLISESTDPTDISRSLSYLLDFNEEELQLLGDNNRKKAMKLFSSEKIIKQYLSLITK